MRRGIVTLVLGAMLFTMALSVVIPLQGSQGVGGFVVNSDPLPHDDWD